ncbi:MAG TPA: ABC transporter substrate-binding protein, partial [Ktedonobacteraceae bacterium]|nr:ABC transporter substrate-binding protein [Ktedonobacteraceae bacterium]
SSHYPFQVRLLIANSGSGDEAVAGQVARQIVQLAAQDKTVVGVMGWPFSESTVHAFKILEAAHIPIVSETASTDDLTGKSSYFFRLVPPNFQQGQANAQYVIQTLHAKRVALFVDHNNAYSSSFADDFKQSYLSEVSGNGTIVAEEPYTVGPKGQAQLSTLLQRALNANPDVIYFSGYASDLAILLDALPSFGPGVSVPIVGGEGLYELGGYNQSSRAHLGQLHFLAYAYPDEWEIAGLVGQKPLFFQEYSDAFNPSGQTPPGVYGLTRAGNDVVLAYDATRTLLTASTSVGQNVTGEQLQQALKQIKDARPLQGVSGRIAFGPDGNPINKPLLLLSVDAQARFHEEALLSGCLLVARCG